MFIDDLSSLTYLHMLDVRTKVLGFIGLTVLVFLFDNPLYNLLWAFLIAILAFASGMQLKKLASLLLPLLPIYVLIMLLSGFTPTDKFVWPLDRIVLLNLWPQNNIIMTVGGILKGCTLIIRIFTMIIASALITLTTPVDDFMQFFSLMKLPYEFSFLITTALRFIPTMNNKRLMIIDAQKSRGAKLQEKGIVAPVQSMIPIMVPMMSGSIMMANNLSKAMLNRGFGSAVERQPLRQISFKQRDYLACIIIILVFITGVYLRFGLKLGRL